MRLTDEQMRRLRDAAREMPPADDFDHGMEMLARLELWAAGVLVAIAVAVAWWVRQ